MFRFLFPAPRLLRLRFGCNVRMRMTPRCRFFHARFQQLQNALILRESVKENNKA